jgi:MFS family permease
MPSVTASSRLRRIQRVSIGLVTLACTLNYVDRATLAVANPLIRHDLGLSIADMGLLLSAFLWAYAAFQLPAGALVDRFGPRKLLGAALFIWSLAQVLGGMVAGFRQFAAARVLLGLGEAPQFSGLARVVRDWYNIRERGLPTGIGLAASKLGPAIAPLILTPLMLSFGWRWMFVLSGLAGMFIAAVWFGVYREPQEAALRPEEKAYLLDGEVTTAAERVTWADWKRLFAYRATWGVIIGIFGEAYMSWVYQTWLPAYLEIERHMSIPKVGWVAGIPFAFGVVGSIGSGWFTDLLAARGVSPVNSCKIPVVIGLLGMSGFTVVGALTADTFVAVVAISTALLFNGMAGAMCWALLSVLAPRHCTASLGGIQNCGGYIGGALAPAVTGFIVQDTGSFVPALLFSASLGLVSAFAYIFVVPAKPIDSAAFEVAMSADA